MGKIEDLTAEQRETLEHYQAFNVPASWFVGETRDDGSVEVVALGDDFAWRLLITAHGVAATSEATLGPWETGITV